jgi:hypothetical protein
MEASQTKATSQLDKVVVVAQWFKNKIKNKNKGMSNSAFLPLAGPMNREARRQAHKESTGVTRGGS